MSGVYGFCHTPLKSGFPFGSRGAGPVGAPDGTGINPVVCARGVVDEPAIRMIAAVRHAAAIVRCLRMKLPMCRMGFQPASAAPRGPPYVTVSPSEESTA